MMPWRGPRRSPQGPVAHVVAKASRDLTPGHPTWFGTQSAHGSTHLRTQAAKAMTWTSILSSSAILGEDFLARWTENGC